MSALTLGGRPLYDYTPYSDPLIDAWIGVYRLTSEIQTALHEPWNLRSSTLLFWLQVQKEAFCNEAMLQAMVNVSNLR